MTEGPVARSASCAAAGPGYNWRMQVCLFDIDGTLLLSGGAGKAAMEAALETEFGSPGGADGVPGRPIGFGP